VPLHQAGERACRRVGLLLQRPGLRHQRLQRRLDAVVEVHDALDGGVQRGAGRCRMPALWLALLAALGHLLLLLPGL
jgi:hypothetical protein